MSTKCSGCNRNCYDNEVMCLGEFSNGRRFELCRDCLLIYQSNRLNEQSPEDAVVYIMRTKMLD